MYFGSTAEELCIQSGPNKVSCQTRSRMRGKGHLHLWGFRAIMPHGLTMTRSHWEEIRHVSREKRPHRAHPVSSTIWWKFYLQVWTETEFWNPSFLKGLMRSLIPGKPLFLLDAPENPCCRGLAFTLQGLMIDSQISSFFSCSSIKVTFSTN